MSIYLPICATVRHIVYIMYIYIYVLYHHSFDYTSMDGKYDSEESMNSIVLIIFFFQVQTEKSEHQISASRDQQ